MTEKLICLQCLKYQPIVGKLYCICCLECKICKNILNNLDDVCNQCHKNYSVNKYYELIFYKCIIL